MKLLYTLDDITDYLELNSGIKIPYSQVRKEEMESIQVK